MFAKLIKYEVKSAGKWYFGLYALTLIFALSLGTFIDSNAFSNGNILGVLIIMLYGGLIVGTSLSTLLLVIRRFYRNLFGREGYLTFTLPVTTHQIILSKLLMAFVWGVINVVVIIMSIILISLSVQNVEWSELMKAVSEISKVFKEPEVWGVILSLITSAFSQILYIYFSIAVGQLFLEKRALMAFVTYFALGIGLSTLNSTLFIIFKFSPSYSLGFSSAIINLVEIVVLYFGTYYVIEHKLNLQ